MAAASAIRVPGGVVGFLPEIRRRTGFSAKFSVLPRVFPLGSAAGMWRTSRGIGGWEFFTPLGSFSAILVGKPRIFKRGGGTLIALLRDKMRFLRRRSAARAEESLLAEVFEAEKAAAAAIAAAKLEAEAWLNGERLAIANETDAVLKALAAQAAENEEAARRTAIEDAAQIVAEADSFSRELRAFGDGELQPLVAPHVATILPGPLP